MLNLDLEHLFYDPWMLKQQQNWAQHEHSPTKQVTASKLAQGIQIINYFIVFFCKFIHPFPGAWDLTSWSPLRSITTIFKRKFGVPAWRWPDAQRLVPVVSQSQSPEVSNVGHLQLMDPSTATFAINISNGTIQMEGREKSSPWFL